MQIESKIIGIINDKLKNPIYPTFPLTHNDDGGSTPMNL